MEVILHKLSDKKDEFFLLHEGDKTKGILRLNNSRRMT